MALFVTQAFFDIVWDFLAEQGSCDGRGGAEYQRVIQEWRDAGCATDVAAFIFERANIGIMLPDPKTGQ